jgi:hypothetical protein
MPLPPQHDLSARRPRLRGAVLTRVLGFLDGLAAAAQPRH